MYAFKFNIEKKEYDQFIKNYKCVSFMQDYRWAYVKDHFKNILCGVYENDHLVMVSSLLIRKIFMNINLAYMPRGPVGDLTNFKLLSFFTKNIKDLAKKNNAYVVTVDPNILKNELFLKEINSGIKTEAPINFSLDNDLIHKNFLSLNYIHKGYVLDINASLQPRYNMVMCLCDNDNNLLSLENVIKEYKSKVRYYLGSFHEKRGVYFERTNDVRRIDEFMSILNFTEKRQNINLRSSAYFKKILESFKDKAVILFGYLDLKKYLIFLKENDGTEDEITEIKRHLEKSDRLLLSASLVILPSNNKIKMSEYLYAGNNLLFPNLRISTGMVYEILKLSIEEKCHYCNLGGVSGYLDDRLSEFKSKFNPLVFEYIGEYDLVINKFIYYPFKYVSPVLKKCKKLIKK